MNALRLRQIIFPLTALLGSSAVACGSDGAAANGSGGASADPAGEGLEGIAGAGGGSSDRPAGAMSAAPAGGHASSTDGGAEGATGPGDPLPSDGGPTGQMAMDGAPGDAAEGGEGDADGPGAPDTAREGWTLYFADEFDGSEVDSAVWTRYHNTYGDGNNELPCLTPDNVYVSGGALHIVARRETVTCPNGSTREFTSGFIGSREKGVYFPRYGRYEIRAKVPHMHALWPAFWLRHRDGSRWAEVDVMEYFHMQVPGRTTSTLHYDDAANVAKGTQFFETPTATPDWHTWAVEIEPSADEVCLKFFVNEEMTSFHGLQAGEPYCFVDTGPFARHPGEGLFDIAINMAVGGNWVGHPDGPLDTLSNGNTVSPEGVQPTTFPTEYVVDYVRVYVR